MFENTKQWAMVGYSSAQGLVGYGRSAYSRLGRTETGRVIRQGVASSFGWSFEDGKSRGFLGLSNSMPAEKYRSFRGEGMSRVSAAGKAAYQGFKQAGLRGTLSGGAKAAFHGFNGLFTAYEIYSGYQEGGTWGAIKGGANAVAMNVAWEVAASLFGGAVLDVGILGAGATYGGYKFMQAAGERGRRWRNLEMGTPIVDTFGTAATIRQRSLQAIQNSHLGGRMALGSEGQLLHKPFYR